MCKVMEITIHNIVFGIFLVTDELPVICSIPYYMGQNRTDGMEQKCIVQDGMEQHEKCIVQVSHLFITFLNLFIDFWPPSAINTACTTGWRDRASDREIGTTIKFALFSVWGFLPIEL